MKRLKFDELLLQHTYSHSRLFWRGPGVQGIRGQITGGLEHLPPRSGPPQSARNECHGRTKAPNNIVHVARASARIVGNRWDDQGDGSENTSRWASLTF